MIATMKILFLHPNMPGQYKHIAKAMAADPNNQVVFLTKPKPGVEIENVTKIEYNVKRDSKPETHRYIIGFERGVLASQEVWRVCKKLKEKGFVPDVIVGHLGWGDGLYLKDIFFDTPILAFFEFFYDAHDSDVTFLNEDGADAPLPGDELARIRTKNALHLFNLTYADWGHTPTFFQRDRHPELFHHKLSVLHDGIDVDYVKPAEVESITLPDGKKLVKGEQDIVTYITRNYEPYRGFPQFMHAAERILKERKNCHIVVVGQDGVSYGRRPPPGTTYREMLMKEVDLDLSRIHFLPYQPYDDMLNVMRISDAHIYLTVPFVLSWSMLESMACGCALIASDTAPVREVIEDGTNGLLADFFSPEDIAAKVIHALDHKEEMQKLRDNARQTVINRYALHKVLPLQTELIQDVANKQFPPPSHAKIDAYSSSILS